MCDSGLYSNELDVLKKHKRTNRSLSDRPLFIFPCGGAEDTHVSRKRFKQYVQENRDKGKPLRGVYCITAEDLARSEALHDLNLLEQEALLAEICDWIIIFAESPGSFCELGAFSALPHAAGVTSVAVDSKYANEQSFLNDGPVKELANTNSPLSNSFYLNLNNPFSNANFARFVSHIRDHIKASDACRLGKVRSKTINRDEKDIHVGPLIHELLDLLQILGPSSVDSLWTIYCLVKGFDEKQAKRAIHSIVLSEDMLVGQRGHEQDDRVNITYGSVIGMMLGCGLVTLEEGLLHSRVHLQSYFMFKETDDADFNDMRSNIMMRKMKHGVIGHVYTSYDRRGPRVR